MKTTTRERIEVIERLTRIGVTYSDAEALRRISNTLRNWFEMECGTERGNASVSIERDDGEGRPFQRIQYMAGNQWVDRKHPVPDREAGAKKRLAAIMAKYRRNLAAYIQGDCRGAALYILRKRVDIKKGDNLDHIYTRGVAVY
jgi:hypothetical protein